MEAEFPYLSFQVKYLSNSYIFITMGSGFLLTPARRSIGK